MENKHILKNEIITKSIKHQAAHQRPPRYQNSDLNVLRSLNFCRGDNLNLLLAVPVDQSNPGAKDGCTTANASRRQRAAPVKLTSLRLLSSFVRVDAKETIEKKEKMFADHVKTIGIQGTSLADNMRSGLNKLSASRAARRAVRGFSPGERSSLGFSAIEVTSRVGGELLDTDNLGSKRTMSLSSGQDDNLAQGDSNGSPIKVRSPDSSSRIVSNKRVRSPTSAAGRAQRRKRKAKADQNEAHAEVAAAKGCEIAIQAEEEPSSSMSLESEDNATKLEKVNQAE